MLSPWQVGVCGGYQGDELGHCGHIFSQYEKYDEKLLNKNVLIW